MPNYVTQANVETRRIPFGVTAAGYRLTITRRDSGEHIRTLEHPNANVPIADLGEGQYRLSLVRLDSNGNALHEPVALDHDVVAPTAEVPTSFAVVQQ